MREEVLHWFERAVQVPSASRAAFVIGNCREATLQHEVLSLLEYDTADSGLAPEPIRAAIAAVIGDEQPAVPVLRVGAFELGRLLGSGGMGCVYEAHRVDGTVRQRAAVKFAQVSPSAGAEYREAVYRRFARERQVLASLRHPYIAGLIDAGATPEGIPYAVIEQVDGVPIDDYCDACLPGREDRIRLVVELCGAVQFAHRNLIIHSDIKPDNVLITADGIPKLIDFGVARDLADEATISTMRAFTPGYASPEQCRSAAATVATDVYGLGAVLYRLLTGASPRQTKTDSLGDAIRAVCEEDVVRPSSLKKDLQGDLENILLKALQREPGRRYGSAQELADDLNRFLEKRPVRATPDSVLYRSRRFVQRHWMPVTAAAVLAAALVVATVASLHQKRQAVVRAAEARRLAETLLFEVHDEMNNVLGATRARERLGQIAVQYLDSVGRERDPELAWELVNAYARLAQSRGGAASSVGDTIGGVHFAAKAMALGAVVEQAGPDAARLDALFRIYEGLASVFLEAERTAEQREAIDRMLRIAPKLAPLRTAEAWKQLARYLDANGSLQQASETWQRAVAVLRHLSSKPTGGADVESELAASMAGLGRAQGLAGDFPAAIASLQEAIRLSEQRVAAEPQTVRSLRLLFWSHIALGDVLGSPLRFSLGRPAAASEQYRKARTIAETLVKADPDNDVAKLDLARAFSREGVALAAVQPEQALELLEHARDMAVQTSTRNHSGLDARLAFFTASIGPLVRLGRFERARIHMSAAEQLARQMEQEGVGVDRPGMLKAEAIRFSAMGLRREAMAVAQQNLELLPKTTQRVLSQNFATVEVLERMRSYASGLDPGACAVASDRLVRTWSELQSIYPGSAFVRERALNARRLSTQPCKG